MMMKTYLAMILSVGILACSVSKPLTGQLPPGFDKEGHRGSRGLMPENTIPAMQKAIDLDVTTLEMDVVISKDLKVVVSHDPYFNENITTTPQGTHLTKAEAAGRLLYTMTYDSISKYDVGLKPHPDFPRQQKIAVSKPLLEELLAATEKYAREKGKTMYYNIEVKSKPENDGKKHPPIEQFVDLVIASIQKSNVLNRTIIQSFDPRALQVLHRKYPTVNTSLLMEGTDKRSLAAQLQELGFTPAVYSPHYSLVTPELIAECKKRNIKVLPWTVNDLTIMKRLKALGVDGIITDYPDLFASL